MATFLEQFPGSDKERGRYRTLHRTLATLTEYFAGRQVLDFGASHALSMCALLEHGAASVTGVEPEAERVSLGREILASAGWAADLLHIEDTRSLPFSDSAFGAVLCNAVLEHIPQPRNEYLREMWRVLEPGGVLIVNETPNKYLPFDAHTTQLMWVPWLPRELARRYAYARRRYTANRSPWEYSGWRGIGYHEMVRPLDGCELIPEISRVRHRIFTRLGIPASILDPYPCWILRKGAADRAAGGRSRLDPERRA